MAAMTHDNMMKLESVVARLIDAGVKISSAQWSNYSDCEIAIQVSGDNARNSMAIIARMMRHAKKRMDRNFSLTGTINGVSVHAYTGAQSVCKIVAYEEVEVPAEPEMKIPARPARKEKRPVYDCTEPLLRTHPVSKGVEEAESQDVGAAESEVG